MMFVGDSLNRGQYVSMVCLLHRLIPEDSKSMETFGSLTVFTMKVTCVGTYKLPLGFWIDLHRLFSYGFLIISMCLSRTTMLQLSSTGHRFSLNRIRTMLSFIEYLTGL